MPTPVRNAAFAFLSIFFAVLAVFVYAVLFQATKASPLAQAGSDEWTRLAVSLIALSALVAVVLSIPAVIWELLLPEGRWRRALTVTIVVAISFAGLLMVIENFSYTLFKFGLKTGDAASGKIGFMLLALMLAWLWQRAVRTAARGALFLWPVSGAVIVGALAWFVVLGLQHQSAVSAHKVQPNVPPYNVLILSTDGIEDEHMSVYGYGRPTTPFLQSVKSQFMVFDDAFSNSGNTDGSLASLLTGISPLVSHVVYPPDTFSQDEAFESLPALLRTAGYVTTNWAVPHFADTREQNLLEAFDREDGDDVSSGWWRFLPLGSGATRWFVIDTVNTAQGLVEDAFFIHEMDNPYAQITGDGPTLEDDARIAGVMQDIESSRPFFINVHLMDTHGALFHVHNPVFSKGKTETDWDPDFFDDSIREYDERVKAIYDRLQAIGKLDNTILIVTSDHGSEWDPKKRVPLMIRFPHAEHAGEITANVQRLDVAPTILAALGYAVPGWMQGANLLDPAQYPPSRKLVAVSVKDVVGVDGEGLVHKGWLDTGTSAIGPNHRIAVLACDRFYRFDVPLNLAETAPVVGSRSPCKSDPAIDTNGIKTALAGAGVPSL
jgi:hypothetical protein